MIVASSVLWRVSVADAQEICLCRTSEPNVLLNAGFDDASSRGSPTSDVGVVAATSYGLSAADAWTLYLNTVGNITTEQLAPSTLGAHGGSLHVKISSALGGIVQYFGWRTSIPGDALITARVYVLKGQVGLGAGNGGSAGLTEVSATNGAWELIRTSASNLPVTEVALYSVGGPADFIVDEITVQPCVPQ
jgi:hypothetical protein